MTVHRTNHLYQKCITSDLWVLRYEAGQMDGQVMPKLYASYFVRVIKINDSENIKNFSSKQLFIFTYDNIHTSSYSREAKLKPVIPINCTYSVTISQINQ